MLLGKKKRAIFEYKILPKDKEKYNTCVKKCFLLFGDGHLMVYNSIGRIQACPTE